MSESIVDVLFLVLSCTALFAVAGVGILALPWKDDELAETSRAVRHAWRRLDDALRVVDVVEAPPRPAHHPMHPGLRGPYLHDRPSVAFERPSMPA
jgi:hypothetical protein